TFLIKLSMMMLLGAFCVDVVGLFQQFLTFWLNSISDVSRYDDRYLLREQEIYWIHRSKATNVLKGDNNTKQFSKWNVIRKFTTILSQLWCDCTIAKKALKIQQYRLIYLLNVSFKIFIKSIKYIMHGVVTLHRTIHEMHRKKKNGLILKLDFEKAYDKVFLLPGAPGYNKQGDPLSPILFNIVVDIGVVPHLTGKSAWKGK
ncbi:hypothetical protein ACJX0J_021020, partial [Zea mays]